MSGNDTSPDAGSQHWHGLWQSALHALRHDMDQDAIFAGVYEDGLITGRYLTMSVLSAAIATLGLMLSSPAVVIGAMLLSPLMGPIILLGFSFRTFDWQASRRAMISLLAGLGLAMAVAVVLTWASPLKEPTAEILARTRPNLFDLLIAAFSGIAGGYAVIRQKGETVIGVAIATALMPPIATVGFGLGTGNVPIAMGALLLFATNLIAIALSAAGMATLYGFHPHSTFADRGLLGQGAVLLVIVALCYPLTISLQTIAHESKVTAAARQGIESLFGEKARIASISVHSSHGALMVDALVATPKYLASAPDELSRRLNDAVGGNVKISLDQVVLADPSKFNQPAASPATAALPRPSQSEILSQSLRDAVPFTTEALAYDADTHRGLVVLGDKSGIDLTAAMKLEQGLRQRHGLSGTIVLPPVQPLPHIAVSLSKSDPPAFGPELALDSWALSRWSVHSAGVMICGLRSRDRRRKLVLDGLKSALETTEVTLLPSAGSACLRTRARAPYLTLTPL